MSDIEIQEPTTVQETTEDDLTGLLDESSLNEDGTLKSQTSEASDELVDETKEPKKDEPEKEEPEEVEETIEETDKPFLTVKYNKEEKGLSQEEAITLAQKGMNYDHLQDKVDSMSKDYSRLEEQAKLNGMEIGEYLDKLDEVQKQFEYSNALEKAKQENPEADEKLLERIVKAEIELSRKDKELNKVNTKTKIAEDKQADLQKQIDKFLNIHKDIKVDQLQSILTDDMYKLMDDGYTIAEAYDIVKSKEAVSNSAKEIAQVKVSQKKEENKSKSLGNLTNSGDTKKDALEEAMLSAFAD